MIFVKKTEKAYTEDGNIIAPFCKLRYCAKRLKNGTEFCIHLLEMKGFGQTMKITCEPPEGYVRDIDGEDEDSGNFEGT